MFHSTDDRSLSENFFRESELDAWPCTLPSAPGDPWPTLAVTSAIRTISFTALSKERRGAWWYFFPEKELADLPLRAGSAALSAYVGAGTRRAAHPRGRTLAVVPPPHSREPHAHSGRMVSGRACPSIGFTTMSADGSHFCLPLRLRRRDRPGEFADIGCWHCTLRVCWWLRCPACF